MNETAASSHDLCYGVSKTVISFWRRKLWKNIYDNVHMFTYLFSLFFETSNFPIKVFLTNFLSNLFFSKLHWPTCFLKCARLCLDRFLGIFSIPIGSDGRLEFRVLSRRPQVSRSRGVRGSCSSSSLDWNGNLFFFL